MARPISCILRRHQPDRKRVTKIDDKSYYAHCSECGAPVVRVKTGRWRRDWLATLRLRKRL